MTEYQKDAFRCGFAVLAVLALVAALMFLTGCGTLNQTQRKYATFGVDTLSCATACGVEAAAGAVEGTVTGDAALACLTRCAAANGFKVVAEVLKDVITGATGGGWFGSADERPQHVTVYRVVLVKDAE